MTSKLILEGPGGPNPWAAKNIWVSLLLGLAGGTAYGMSFYCLGLTSGRHTFYLSLALIWIIICLAMTNFIYFRSATFVAYLNMTSNIFSIPALVTFMSIAYYQGYPVIWIIIAGMAMVGFVFWSQSSEVQSVTLDDYFARGIEDGVFQIVKNIEVIYALKPTNFASKLLGSVNYPHKNFAKFIRGLAIVLGIIVIPFGQKEVYADPSREYQNMPTIVMLLAFVFFVMVPHFFSSQFMLIKLDRAIKRGEVEPNEFAKADEVA